VLARVSSCALFGIDAYFVEVEVDVGRGLPSFSTVGLPDAAVRESRERVLSAIRNSGLEVPPRRIVVNLAPADTRKEGAGFDLAVAVSLLAATGQLPCERSEGIAFVGELSLDGRLRSVRGVLSMALLAKHAKVRGMIVPTENGEEAFVALGERDLTASTLSEVVGFLRGQLTLPSPRPVGRTAKRAESTTIPAGSRAPAPERLRVTTRTDTLAAAPERQSTTTPTSTPAPVSERPDPTAYPDFSDVRGQHQARRALEVAAAGGHNVIMIGPPGSGKSMLARRLPSILPPLTIDEAVETTRIYSSAGRLPRGVALLSTRPFRSPHHTVSAAGVIGGGRVPRPGEVSLSHNGVLFLDELPEFRRDVLEALRQPLEEARLTVTRAGGTVTFPARFMLIAASNPCPCGHFTDTLKECNCTPVQIRNYMGRLSGPLLDRIDIHVYVPRLAFQEISKPAPAENSQSIRERVLEARALQLHRYGRIRYVRTNSDLGEAVIRRFCLVDEPGLSLLKAAMERLGLSGRAFHRILKVARTIADLAGSDLIETQHVAEAIQYRSLDRTQFSVPLTQ